MNIDYIRNSLNKQLIKITFSGPRNKSIEYLKVILKPFLKGNELFFQFESFTSTQAFHENYSKEDAINRLYAMMDENLYKQINGETETGKWQMLISKKGKINFKEQAQLSAKKTQLNHNRKKTYIMEDGIPVKFLVALGVMTEDGKVVKKRYDKFKQINRFMEMVQDVVKELPTNRVIKIIDFGCGRSYLTFALYHYLVTIKGLKVEMVGLDLKEKVIDDCNKLAQRCDYSQLHFKHGDIVDYDETKDVDMVVTLHACDRATDLAMQKAVNWNAKVIMSVPCCQHELNATIENEFLDNILQYGIIKERMAALITDATRANWLKLKGYEVQILEFIDVAHTPKNLLIRAVKIPDFDSSSIDYTEMDKFIKSINGNLTIRK